MLTATFVPVTVNAFDIIEPSIPMLFPVILNVPLPPILPPFIPVALL